MKQFFSIEINHEYDRIDENTIDASDHLAIVPASSNSMFVKNNRLWFRTQTGILDCFIEDDAAVKNEVDVLFFWVVCNNPSFFSYTDNPADINFSNPYYYWSNFNSNNVLQQSGFCDLHPGQPPIDAIGCIGISITEINEHVKFKIDFEVRKTYWVYHITPNATQKFWQYKIEDSQEGNDNIVENVKWIFIKVSEEGEDPIIFRSKEPMPYFKKASDRFKLKWQSKEVPRLQDPRQMVLPFPNYAYKMVDEDNNELTPIYIYI